MQFKGVILNPRLPAESSLGVELDLTGLFTESGADYMSFKQGLEDRLNRLDREYAKQVAKLRGRRLGAQYKTYSKGKEKVRGRFLFVIPYPSRFSTTLSQIRTEFYDRTDGLLVRHNCVPLSSIVEGRHKFVTYFLHEQDASLLQREVESKLNSKIMELNRDIIDFERSNSFKELMDYILSKVDKNRWSRFPVRSSVHPIELHYQPIIIGKEIVEMYTDATLREELKKRMRELAMNIVDDFHEKLLDLIVSFIERIEKNKVDKESMNRLEAKYRDIQEVVNRYGISEALQKELNVVQSLIEASRSGKIEKSVGDIAGYVGVAPANNTASTLREIGMKLKNVSEETKAFIEAVF